MFSKIKNDLPASIVVFLVALPLCLGVALASGAPLISGIISGIVGGIVVGIISKSATSVSGPAAGLTKIVAASILTLGSFETFLVAVFVAGLLQIILGMLKMGVIAHYFPSNVIKGLLASIGLIFIFKQIPHAIGFDKDYEGDYDFVQMDGENSFSTILHATKFITPGAILLSIVSLLILIYWNKTFLKKYKFLPASLVVVFLGIGANLFFSKYIPFLKIENTHLVNIPFGNDFGINLINITKYVAIPDLSKLANSGVWILILFITLEASLETLVNVEAVDKLDPHKRTTPTNRELVAQGCGNMVAGVLGGLPITSVVVRSSVNIQAGSKTKLSAILHGIFMLVSVLFLGNFLNLIPLASLAAILIVTGYNLTRVSLFKNMYKLGWDQFIPFVVTILTIIFINLIAGISIGLGVSIIFLLRSNFVNPFVKNIKELHIGEITEIGLQNQVSVFNKPKIVDMLYNIPPHSKVIINGRFSNYVDFNVIEAIKDFKDVVAVENDIALNIYGLKKFGIEDSNMFVHVLDKETQNSLSPRKVLDLLKEGNARFNEGNISEKYFAHQVNATLTEQNPMAVIITCIDSRTTPEIIFDAGLGDILTIRIAGNIISDEVLGSLEIAVGKLGAKLIVVKGHSRCGAVGLAISDVTNNNIGTITSKIKIAIDQCKHKYDTLARPSVEAVKEITQLNVRNSIVEILSQSTFIRQKVDAREIGIVGAYHDLETGVVTFEKLIEGIEAEKETLSGK